LVEIDAVHLRVRESLRRRDLPGYVAAFTADLRYQQPDGRVISREQLSRNISGQMDRLVAFDSGFKREASAIAGEDVVETGVQTAWIALRVFAIFAVQWRIERHGQYVWTQADGEWKLREVRVERELVTRAGFSLASRAAAV